jgi:hypothetical protein
MASSSLRRLGNVSEQFYLAATAQIPSGFLLQQVSGSA